MKKRFNKKGILTTAMLLTASTFATFGACFGGEEQQEQVVIDGYSVPTETTIEVGAQYTPDFSVSGSVTAQIVDLAKAPKNSYARLKDGSFTPDVLGDYTYVVRIKEKTEEREKELQETITVKAIDTTAPVFSGEIADKKADVGMYSALATDLASIDVADNCAKTVSVYAESIVYNGETTLLGKGVDSVRLSNVGEYTVNVVAEDFSGNKARTSYKVVTSDTTAPVFNMKSVAIAWANDGKVTLPTAKVVDNTAYTLKTTVKNSAGDNVEVVDGKINASAGVYTVTYTAKDIADNETTKEVKLVVKENGVITDFAVANEETLWATDGVRLENGKLKTYYMKASNYDLTYVDGFTVNDWSDYVSFEATFTNNRGAKLSITPYFFVDGQWKETAAQTVAPNATGTVKVYLSDYNLEKVDGVRLALNCDGGVVVDLDNVLLSKTADNRSVPAGYTACDISAQGSKELTINQSANNKGVVKYTIYANVDCDIMTVLNYENGSVSAIKSLKAGLNEIVRYPDAEADKTVTNSKLVSMVVSSFENYDVKLAVSSLSYENLSSIDINAYAITSGSYSVGYNETFAIPSPFTSSMRWYQNLTVTLKQGSTTVKNGLSIGSILETVGENALSAGDYTIVYSFKDLAGASKTITYSLTVNQNILTATLTMPALFANEDGFDLPDAEITSAVYGDAAVQNGATVEKYYRMAGRTTWTKVEADGKFMPVANKTYEIKYVVEYDGKYTEINTEKFIHVNEYTLDFEAEEDVGEDMFAGRYKKDETMPDGTVVESGEKYVMAKSRFLHDGGYYDYKSNLTANRWEVTKDWSKSGTTSITQFSPATRGYSGFLIRPVIAKEGGFNAITFWMKADKDHKNFDIEIGISAQDGRPYNNGPWIVCEPFDLLAGEHFYTLYFQEPIPAHTEIGCVNFLMAPGNRLYLDDLQFVYIDRFEVEDINTYENQIDNTEGYEITKPVLTTTVMTAEQLAKVSYVLTYSLNGKEETEIKPNANDKYILKLADGEYGEVVFKWTVSTYNYWSTVGGEITKTFTSGKVLINCATLDFEHAEIVLQDSETTLALPTSTAGEVSNAKVEYKAFGSDEWIALADGNMSIPTDTVGWFDIRYTADVTLSSGKTVPGFALSQIYVRDKLVLVDFEGSDPFNGGTAYFNTRGKGTVPAYEIVADPENPYNTVQKILHINNAWEGVWYEQPFVFDEAYNVFYVRIYAVAAVSGYTVEIFTGTSANALTWKYWNVDLEKGWNEIYYVTDEFTVFSSFNGKIKSDIPTIMFDDIKLLRIENVDGMPKTAVYGVETTLPVMTLNGKSATLSYRVKGTDEWTALDGTKWTPMAVGTFEIRVSFEGITSIVKEVAVEFPMEGIDNLPASAKKGENVNVPTVTSGSLTATASYRETGATDWIPVAGSFVAEKVGSYEVRFYFAEVDVEIIRTVTIVPANEFLLFDFETAFDEDDANYTNYNHLRYWNNTLRPTTDVGRVEYYRWEEAGLGGKSLFIVHAAGWEGPINRNGIDLGFETDTFKLKIKGQAFTNREILADVYVFTGGAVGTNGYEFIRLTLDYDNAVDLGNGWFDCTMTINKKISKLHGFEFNTLGYYVDDIRAIDTSK